MTQETTPADPRLALIDLIGELGREVFYLLDDCETSGPVDAPVHMITAEALAKVSAVLDRIDELPFEEEGYILGTGAKLQAALKQTFLAQPDASDPRLDECVAFIQEYDKAIAEWAAVCSGGAPDPRRDADCRLDDARRRLADAAREAIPQLIAMVRERDSDLEGWSNLRDLACQYENEAKAQQARATAAEAERDILKEKLDDAQTYVTKASADVAKWIKRKCPL